MNGAHAIFPALFTRCNHDWTRATFPALFTSRLWITFFTSSSDWFISLFGTIFYSDCLSPAVKPHNQDVRNLRFVPTNFHKFLLNSLRILGERSNGSQGKLYLGKEKKRRVVFKTEKLLQST